MKKAPDPKIFIALAALTFLVGGYATYSMYGNVQTAEARVASVQAEVDKSETIKKDLESSRTSLQELQVKLAHLEKGVQDYQYVPKMLKDLEQFGKANGIDVVGVRPQLTAPSTKPDQQVTKKAYDQVTIEIKGRGKYSDALRFISALNQFPQILAVRTVTLTPKADSKGSMAGSPDLEMVANLNVFVFPTDAAAPAAGQPDAQTGKPVASAGVSNNG
jgi:Tfp pilus assembly protein PilO